jgi:hypothetical protein
MNLPSVKGDIYEKAIKTKNRYSSASPEPHLNRYCLATRSMAVPGVPSGTTSMATSIAPYREKLTVRTRLSKQEKFN